MFSMVIHAATFNQSGYGRIARSVFACLGGRICSDDVIPKELESFKSSFKPNITVSLPHANTHAPVQFTMYESDVLPSEYVLNLNKRKLIIVPSEHNKVSFDKSGVIRPIEVCNLGVIPRYVLPPPFSKFTFLHISADSGVPERKRSVEIVEAFKKAFPTQCDVRLIVKKSPKCKVIPNFDNRVEIITKDLSPEKMSDLYKSSHVGVFISGQESWGYPHSDLMAIGRPIISPCYDGPAEYFNDSNGYTVRYTLKTTPKTYFNSIGKCAWVKIESLISTLHFCYENKEDTILKGVHSYRTMLRHSMNTMSTRLKEILHAYTNIS